MISYEYECWKCPDWHNTDARGVWHSIAKGYARPAVIIRGRRYAPPRRLWYWRERLTREAIRQAWNLALADWRRRANR